ncbi:4-hydroxysphinganine ceramide fatty acyl 2-hydroxylase [Malassezia sp. CBS 17886]|nr:4-hydroxysphinganine ceramide fatty acyl 2-hydroxylase [Malassezia sp. CBS 17886]
MSVYTRAEVAEHRRRSDCWVTCGGGVFNVTDFLDGHPGGDDVILEYAGKDVGEVMGDALSHEHSQSAYAMLEDFRVGTLEGGAPSAFTRAVAAETITEDFKPSETDARRDLAENKFLDLDRPLIPQMWRASFTKEFYLEQVHIPRHRKEPAQLMPNAFLEMFTITPWYVVPMLWLPIAAAFFHQCAGQFRDVFAGSEWGLAYATASTLAAYAVGLLFWTFIEYLFHRFLFHMDDALPRGQMFYLLHFLLHGIHHFLPMDRYRLVMPPIMFAALSFPMVMLAHAVLPGPVANGVIAGSYTMYVVYDTMHYALHHTKLPAYLRKQKRYHLEHHYKNYELGFGVTSKLWDIVFHTLLQG